MNQMLIIISSLLFLLMGFAFLVGMLNTPNSKRYKQMMTLTGIGFVLFISSVFVGQIKFTSKQKEEDNESQQIEVPQSTPVEIIVEEPKVEVPVVEEPVETAKEPAIENPKEPVKNPEVTPEIPKPVIPDKPEKQEPPEKDPATPEEVIPPAEGKEPEKPSNDNGEETPKP